MKYRLTFIKLGVKSIGRLGVTSFVCLVFGMCLIFFSVRGLSAISSEKAQPCTVTIQANVISDAQIFSASSLPGVLKCTAVIPIQSQLYIEDNVCNLTVYAVDPGWIENIIIGENLPLSSTMPYLVLSKAALEGFTDITGKTVFSDTIDWANSGAVLNGFPCEVCGITADDTAYGYISHSAAESMLLFNGEIPAYTQLWLRLENSGYEEKVINALSASGLTATSQNSAKWQEWKSETRNAIILLFAGISVILASVAIIWEKTKADITTHKGEYTFLRHMGADKRDIVIILVSRILMFIAISIVVAAALYMVIPILISSGL